MRFRLLISRYGLLKDVLLTRIARMVEYNSSEWCGRVRQFFQVKLMIS